MSGRECGICGRDAGDAYACTVCAQSARDHLANIASLTKHLDSKRAKQHSNWTTGTIGRTSGNPLPYDPRVTTIANPILAQLLSIAGPGMPPNDGTINETALWLACRVDQLRHHPNATSNYNTFEHAQDALILLFDNPPDRLYLGRCGAGPKPGCTQSLYVDADQDGKPDSATITCPACLSTTPISTRQDQLKAGVNDYLGTSHEISSLCRGMLGEAVSPAMIRGYAHRGAVASKGTRLVETRAGHRVADLYRIGDILDAAANARVREETRKQVAAQARRLTRLAALESTT